jgi:MFS family permease
MLFPKASDTKVNFFSFLWHSLFLALAKNFMDVNTIIPAMLISAGGTTTELGILTAIMIGGASFMQIVFAGFLFKKERKKKYLLTGIYLRVGALLGLGFLLSKASGLPAFYVICAIFILISIFSFSGSFANISYTDILGKSILGDARKKFFVFRQVILSAGILMSAILVRYLVRRYAYPHNYSILFVSAGALLLIASLGFWMIREKPTDFKSSGINFLSVFTALKKMFVEDVNLRYYILLRNTTGIGLTLVPFYISLAKKHLGLTAQAVGNFLLLQIIGMIVSNLLWHFLVKKGSYKGLVRTYTLIGSLLPIFALIFSTNKTIYPFIFLLSGFNISAYQIALPGILLEISKEHNRALYTALSGAGSFFTITFPMIAGALITYLGYSVVFGFSVIITATSVLFLSKIDCKRIVGDT